MPERIYKLQPDRTVHLRGFDTFAAAASIHSASPSGFTASGTFRDPADFAVVVLYDADNFFEHPSIKYLPDFDFSGLTLNFTLQYSDGLQPIDSPKYNWIDWATLDCLRADGTTARIRLWDNAILANGFVFSNASATCTVQTPAAGIQAFDRLTLWYQNVAFDYQAPAGKTFVEYQFFAHTPGTIHSISINGRTYSHTEAAKETGAAQASALIGAIVSGNDPDVTASAGSASNAVRLTIRDDRPGVLVPVSASDGNGPETLRLITPDLVASNLTGLINGANWISANTPYALMAAQSGANIAIAAARYGSVNVTGTAVSLTSGAVFTGIAPGAPIRIGGASYVVAAVQSPTGLTLTAPATAATGVQYVAPRGGREGNTVQLYATNSTDTLTLDNNTIQLAGGSSNVAWNCSIDFSALAIDQLRQCWLTFAPSLVIGPYPSTEWQAVFSNWQLTGPEASKTLSFAGPGSVRIEETDSACVFTGAWTVDGPGSAFYSRYFAKVTSSTAASVTVTYTCQFQHDLYLGTSLYSDRGVIGIRLDNDAETSLDCRISDASAVITRRRLRTAVPAGKHTVTMRLQQAGHLYFDFLEAAVLVRCPGAADAPNQHLPRPRFRYGSHVQTHAVAPHVDHGPTRLRGTHE